MHQCPQHCHQLHDHSKMLCEHVLESKCAKGHLQRYKCHANVPGTCRVCKREDERRQKELQAKLERDAKCEQEQADHSAKIAELDEQIRLVREEASDKQATEERAQALEQKKRDLDMARRLAQQHQDVRPGTKPEAPEARSVSSTSEPPTVTRRHTARGQEKTSATKQNEAEDMKSAPERAWDRQKRVDGESNSPIDALMGLTGLTDVKAKILRIKAKVETVLRQGTDMKNERLGIVLLGNPGTGRCLLGILLASLTA